MSAEIVGHSLTYVEIDVDLYRITRFEAARAGVTPAGWASQWNATTTLLGATSSAMPSGRAARLQKSGGNRSAWSWGVVPDLTNVSAVALLRSQVASPLDMGVVLRVSGGDGTDNGYLLRLQNGVNLQLIKIANGTLTSLQTIAFAHAHDENLWCRFDAANVAGPGVLVRGKVWRGALSDEPTAFMVAVTDAAAPHTAAGKIGLYAASASTDVLCGHFRAKALLGSAVETMRFAKATDYLPRDIDAIPDLAEASLSPSAISLGENLGERATLSVVLNDHLGADLGELYARGTHWGKLRPRRILRRGQPVRVKRGLLGTAFANFETRNYVFDSLAGPSPQGQATLIAKDPLKLADNDRALFPAPTNCFLSADILAGAGSATVAPVGSGNALLPASGHVAIGGKEIIAFTRAGDVLTLTARGQFGTQAIDHKAEDRVQLCRYFNGVDAALIVNTLLTEGAGIAASYIPLSDWTTETATFLQRVYTRMIAEPTGVNELVSQLIEQAGLAVWYDDADNQIMLRVLRGIPVDAFLYSPRNIRGKLEVQDQPHKQITQVITWYGVRNPLEPLDQTDNYRSGLSTSDLEEETASGSSVKRVIFGTWIPALARTTAQRVNDLQIGRFVVPPRRFNFDVQRYSGVEVPRAGGGYRLEFAASQDEAGDPVAVPIQILRFNPMADCYRVEAEEMQFKIFDAGDLKNRVIPIDADYQNFVGRTAHDSIYGAPTTQDVINGVNLTITVNAGAIVGSNSVALRAFDVGLFPTAAATGNIGTGSPIVTALSVAPTNMKVGTPVTGAGIQAQSRILTIDGPTQITLDKPATATTVGVALTFWFYVAVVVVGRLQGKGADGGTPPNGAGQAGGVALYTRHPILLTSTAGQIWSGGGGGGASAAGEGGSQGGGGGAGTLPGLGGGGLVPGAPGTADAGGAPGGPFAGGGGGPGLPGVSAGGVGGAAGAAIDGDSFVTDSGAVGDIRGAQIN